MILIFLKLYTCMNYSCTIFCLGKALAGTMHVYSYMLKAPINLKQMQITLTCHCVILFILKVQKSLPNLQNFSQFSEEENSEHSIWMFCPDLSHTQRMSGRGQHPFLLILWTHHYCVEMTLKGNNPEPCISPEYYNINYHIHEFKYSSICCMSDETMPCLRENA